MLVPAPSSSVPQWRSTISMLVPIVRASSNALTPAASASDAKVERRSYSLAGQESVSDGNANPAAPPPTTLVGALTPGPVSRPSNARDRGAALLGSHTIGQGLTPYEATGGRGTGWSSPHSCPVRGAATRPERRGSVEEAIAGTATRMRASARTAWAGLLAYLGSRELASWLGGRKFWAINLRRGP